MRSLRIDRAAVLRALALTVLAAALALASPALSKTTTKTPTPGKPHAATGGVDHFHGSTGQLNGSVNPGGLETTYYFQYGPTTAYGSQTPAVAVPAGFNGVKVGQTVNGLLPGYHYRLVANNKDGQSLGKDKTVAGSKKRLRFSFGKVKGPQRLTGYRGTYVLSGTLTGVGGGNHPIVLQADPYPYRGAFTNVGPVTATNAAGGFSFHISQLTQNTKFRVEALGARPLFSQPLVVSVAVNVTIHARVSAHTGLARVYGTVAPAVAGTVIVQVLKPAKEGGKHEATGPKAQTVSATKLKRATATLSRFSIVLKIRGTGHYRVYVRLAKGPLVSGYSQNVLIRVHTAPAKKRKGKGKKKA
ncbi:MAG TPA: hypothetical protein VES97_07250 [Solirubrobacteraceae bacterium]|nr:hypothetical protein [Solirubrobacteraceae bacterium]